MTDRIAEITSFYRTSDREDVKLFLEKYNISYIILGQLEKAYYPGSGLKKFAEWNGILWDEVYHDEDTYIYRVIK